MSMYSQILATSLGMASRNTPTYLRKELDNILNIKLEIGLWKGLLQGAAPKLQLISVTVCWPLRCPLPLSHSLLILRTV